MKFKTLISLSLLILILSISCASKRPCGNLCDSSKSQGQYSKNLFESSAQANEAAIISTLSDSAFQKIKEYYEDPSQYPEQKVISLSAGGQYGAFGAGFIIGWYKNKANKMPRFDVVTSVSTGSLLAPYLFLLSGDDLDSFEGEEKERQKRIREEVILILSKVYGDGLKNSDVVRGNPIINLVKRKALYDRKPLRKLLNKYITEEYLNEIANQCEKNEIRKPRSLLVGAVSLDTQKFVIFNLGAIALNYRNANDEQTKKAHKKLFIDTIMASSAVPVAFSPVFIDGQMYIDGGAREYVFFKTIDDTLVKAYDDAYEVYRSQSKRKGLTPRSKVQPVNTFYMILHGDYDIKSKLISYDPKSIALRSMTVALDNILRLSVFYNAYLATSINGEPENCTDKERETVTCQDYIPETELETPHPWRIRVLSATGNNCETETLTDELFDPGFTKCLYRIGEEEGSNDTKDWICDVCELAKYIDQTKDERYLVPIPREFPICKP